MEGKAIVFDALTAGDVITGSSEELRVIVVWNGSATFNVYYVDSSGDWYETDVFTRYGDEPGGSCTERQAIDATREYLHEGEVEVGIGVDA